MKSAQAFEEAYKTLTPSQKKAVDTVEGPVLVIAGPGTGKTHILTLRIANILLKTQANPSNILVLTFTDSAARTVRRRLGELIGDSVAREVTIATFHGFAEQVLSKYSDSFVAWSGKRLMGDVENTLLWREVFENEEVRLLSTPKSPFHYLRDLATLQKDLVRERISLDEYQAWAKEEVERIGADESLRYVRGEKAGEMKPDGLKKLERYEKVYEACRLIEAYESYKEQRGVYDFADVLRTVVDTMQSDPALQAELQETYQYVLADEHQDANALQHALLDALAYDEHPNLFVVGDEKQAIFRFQGADSTHFREFRTRYPRAELITLTDSFRSLQGILDAAHTLAEERLPSTHGAHEALSAHREGAATISLLESPDPLAERDQVASLVEERIHKGVAPHEIAVITSKNATANLFAAHLAAKGVPVLRAGDMALDSRPFVRSLLALIRAIASPGDTSALREALLAPWWSIPLPERAKFLMRTRDKELMQELDSSYPAIANSIRELQKVSLMLPPLELFSKLLVDSGARAFALSNKEHLTEDMVLLRKLVMHVEEAVQRDPNTTFAKITDALTKAREHGLAGVKSSVLQRKGHVTVITAHKAKGMEFTHVFITGLTAQEWEKGGKSPLIPSPVDSKRSMDDVIRQFYVAVTRAKDEIVLSYAKETGDGKERPPSSLIPDNLPLLVVAYDPLPLVHDSREAPELVRALTHTYLTEEGLSPSALKEYLESPACFFAKRVLRLREPETQAITIGNAVHEAIAAFLKEKSEDKAYAALEHSLKRSLLPRNAVFETLSKDARARVSQYLAHTHALGEAVAVEKTYLLKRTIEGVEVLLRGKVDAVFSHGSGECIVDFKTSSTVRGHDEEYRHQLAFYDLLLRENELAPIEAKIIQVTATEVVEHPVPLTKETRAEFLSLLDEVIAELVRGTWRKGEPSVYDDVLELFK